MTSQAFSTSATEDEIHAAKHLFKLLTQKNLQTNALIGIYDKTKDEYDQAMKTTNYNAPRETALTLSQLFPQDRENVTVLDLGAGTGLVAEELYKHGFRKMDAVDASQGMLDEAKRKQLYNNYYVHVLGETNLNLPNESYDAVILCGMAFEPMKFFPIETFEDMIRLTKPGGYVLLTHFRSVFVEGDDSTANVRQHLKELAQQGKWTLQELREFKNFILGRDGAVAVYRK